jgi:hypothetical protein
VSVVGKIIQSLSPDNGMHTVSLAVPDPASLVIAAVHSSEGKPPCGRVLSHRDPCHEGRFLQDRSMFLTMEHLDRIVIMSMIGKPRGTGGNASVCKLQVKLPDNPLPERIPGSFMLLSGLTVESSLDKVPRLCEELCLKYLGYYRAAAEKGMYRGKAVTFDKFKYTAAVQAEYKIEKLKHGMATHFIVRNDQQALTTVDWLFLQRYLSTSCDKPPALLDPNKPGYYVVTRSAALA